MLMHMGMKRFFQLVVTFMAAFALVMAAPAAALAGSLDYEVVEGADQTIAYGEDLVLTAGGEASELDHVEIDSEVLDSSAWTCDEDTMELVIDAEALEGLDAGEHALVLVYEDGTGETAFTLSVDAEAEASEDEAEAGDAGADADVDAEDGDSEDDAGDDAASEEGQASDAASEEDADDEGASPLEIAALVVVAAAVIVFAIVLIRR